MKIQAAWIAFLMAASMLSRATDLIIERLVIQVTPIQGTYFAAVSAEADKATAKFYTPSRPFAGNGIEIPVNMVLKDVEKNHWCKITLQLDKSDADVATYKAMEKHTTRFQINDSGTESFVPYQNPNHTWMWKIVYSTK